MTLRGPGFGMHSEVSLIRVPEESSHNPPPFSRALHPSPLSIHLLHILIIPCCIVFSYRLSRLDPFPLPYQDCLTALIGILKWGEKLGIDPQNVAIMGKMIKVIMSNFPSQIPHALSFNKGTV